jgi:hypothetical protein
VVPQRRRRLRRRKPSRSPPRRRIRRPRSFRLPRQHRRRCRQTMARSISTSTLMSAGPATAGSPTPTCVRRRKPSGRFPRRGRRHKPLDRFRPRSPRRAAPLAHRCRRRLHRRFPRRARRFRRRFRRRAGRLGLARLVVSRRMPSVRRRRRHRHLPIRRGRRQLLPRRRPPPRGLLLRLQRPHLPLRPPGHSRQRPRLRRQTRGPLRPPLLRGRRRIRRFPRFRQRPIRGPVQGLLRQLKPPRPPCSTRGLVCRRRPPRGLPPSPCARRR